MEDKKFKGITGMRANSNVELSLSKILLLDDEIFLTFWYYCVILIFACAIPFGLIVFEQLNYTIIDCPMLFFCQIMLDSQG